MQRPERYDKPLQRSLCCIARGASAKWILAMMVGTLHIVLLGVEMQLIGKPLKNGYDMIRYDTRNEVRLNRDGTHSSRERTLPYFGACPVACFARLSRRDRCGRSTVGRTCLCLWTMTRVWPSKTASFSVN